MQASIHWQKQSTPATGGLGACGFLAAASTCACSWLTLAAACMAQLGCQGVCMASHASSCKRQAYSFTVRRGCEMTQQAAAALGAAADTDTQASLGCRLI